ncbi:DUF2237 family protein [Gymnodinialimonas ulvae]|uniref:DUF2237 family protein n=1 Tax=Gymnodinialimonas ulvae TaxID=3126504 RepID=UPI00309C95B1
MGFKKADSLNVFGEALQTCSTDPMTGFYRDGSCETCAEDHGAHTVCCVMTKEFLAFSKYVGNDLSTPRPQYQFPGLKPGDGWCVCASRWLQAAEEGAAPLVNLAATHKRALEIIPLEMLEAHAAREEH